MKSRRFPILAVAGIALLASLGCSDEFDSFFEINDFRLLGMRADAPALHEGETSTLSALVTESDATYRWTWCPLSSGPAGGYECAVTEEELQASADELLGPGVLTIPPFELGSEATAQYTYSIPAALFQGVCEVILQNELPDGVDVPACEGSFDIQIRLDVEKDGKTEIAVRDLELLFEDDAVPNSNPSLLGVRAVHGLTGEETILDAAAATSLEAGVVYDLFLDIEESSSEEYPEIPRGGTDPLPTREELTTTWFRETGDMDKGRTGFIDDNVPFDTLLKNEWTPPADEAGPTRLFMVLRDNRGGVDFMSREIELVQP